MIDLVMACVKKAANGDGGVWQGRWWMFEEKDSGWGSLGLHLHPAP